MKIELGIGGIRVSTLAEMCGGDVRDGRGSDRIIKGICTDSREADGTTVFCALRGERVDGHDYIRNALDRGCPCVLCERSCEELEAAGAAAVVVSDSELALSRFANAYRQELSCHTVAVTGSVGKTTTKDLIASVLSVGHKTFSTPGNHNSVIGMPLSMAQISTDSEWSVLEMGMSGFGEIERLSVVAEPDYAVITNIGTAHMELLGSRENICRAKLEILCGLRDGGTLLLSADEPLLRGIGGKNYKTVYVSTECEKADYFAKNIRVENNLTYFDICWKDGEEKDLCIRPMGKHNVYAALFAFAIAHMEGLSRKEIRDGLLAYAPRGLRQHMAQVGDWTFFQDCYNASPESMIAALDILSEYTKQSGRRSVAVLGDMLELGRQSGALHRKVGAYAAEKGIDLLVCIGAMGNQIAVGARQSGMKESSILRMADADAINEIRQMLLDVLKKGDVVLFKASRGLRAERIISALSEHAEGKSE